MDQTKKTPTDLDRRLASLLAEADRAGGLARELAGVVRLMQQEQADAEAAWERASTRTEKAEARVQELEALSSKLSREWGLERRQAQADVQTLRARLAEAEEETQRQRERYRAVARAVRPGGDISETREVVAAAEELRQHVLRLEEQLATARNLGDQLTILRGRAERLEQARDCARSALSKEQDCAAEMAERLEIARRFLKQHKEQSPLIWLGALEDIIDGTADLADLRAAAATPEGK